MCKPYVQEPRFNHREPVKGVSENRQPSLDGDSLISPTTVPPRTAGQFLEN